MIYYELKIESPEGEIEITDENIITYAEVMFDTINNETKTKSDAILAKMTICGNIAIGKDTSINEQAIKISEWARDLDKSTTYRNVTLIVKSDSATDFRTYVIPDMFVVDYTESYKSASGNDNDAYNFELKLTQSENKLKEIKTYQ